MKDLEVTYDTEGKLGMSVAYDLSKDDHHARVPVLIGLDTLGVNVLS